MRISRVLPLVMAVAIGGKLYATTFTVLPLIMPAGGGSVQGLNNNGQVVGWTSNGSNFQAYLLSTTLSPVLIPTPAGYVNAVGLGINDSGIVVGRADDGLGHSIAFVGTPGGSTALPLPANATASDGQAINNSGQVTGEVSFGGLYYAYVGTTGGVTLLPLPAGAGSTAITYGYAINTSGQVAGDYYNGVYQPFTGTTAGTSVVPLPPECVSDPAARSMNDLGQIVGYCSNGTHNVGFLYNGTSSAAIPTLPGYGEVVITQGAINNSGTVVGIGFDASFNRAAWMWDSTNGIQALSNLVPAGWDVQAALGINNNGQILAQANSQYVLLDPVGRDGGGAATLPEPGTFGLIGPMLIGLAGWQRSRR